MEEENTELNSHLYGKLESDPPIDIKQNDSHQGTQSDVTPLRNDSDTNSCFSKEDDGRGFRNPVDVRNLDSVFQYTSKIRAFIGIVDPEDSPPTGPPQDTDSKSTNSTDVRSQNLEECDDINNKPIELEKRNINKLQEIVNGRPVELEKKTNKELPETVNDKPTELEENNIRESEDTVNNASTELEENNNHEFKETVNDTPIELKENNNHEFEETANDTPIELKENNKDELKETENGALNLDKQSDKDDDENRINSTKFPNDVLSINADVTNTTNKIDNNDQSENSISTSIGDNEILITNNALSVVDVDDVQNETTDLNVENTSNSQFSNPDNIENLVELNEDLNDGNVTNNSSENKVNQLMEPEKNLVENEHPNESKPATQEEVKNTDINCDPSDQNMSTNSDVLREIVQEENNFKTLNEQKENISTENTIENEDAQNLTDDSNIITEQNYSDQEDIIEEAPPIEAIRRMSLEIVNKVLDTAGNQLREMLNEKRQSNAGMGYLDSRSDLNKISENQTGTDNIVMNSEFIDNDNQNNGTDYSKFSGEEDEPVKVRTYEDKLNNEIQLKSVLKTYNSNDFQKKIAQEKNTFDPECDVDPDTICGIGCFKPKWIQPWATARVYLLLYSIIGILSGSYYSYLIGSMSTLEKRFAFKSKISGFIMMLDEITPLVLGIFIGYFGGKSHRPRMVGLGMFMSSMCCFISALPYFIYGPATHLSTLSMQNKTGVELCNDDMREENCDSDDRPPTLAAVLFLMLGSFLKGFGNLAYYAVGLAYMDDNAKKKNTPIYFATAFALRMLGPLVGFLMCSFFLKYYENPFVDPGIEPEDPRWIGCWWMGFLVQGILLLIFSIPISLFPRRLPGTVYHRPDSTSEKEHGLATSFTGLFAALKRLGKNPVFILINVNAIGKIFGEFGHYIMLPKYMENQFKLSASNASLLSGPPAIAAVILSTIIGGYIIWKFKPSAKFLTAGLCILETIEVIGFFLLMIPRCQNEGMTHFGLDNNGLILQSECNLNCNCTTSAFTPVCGPDGDTLYFSPCYAGCSFSGNETFENCSCVTDPLGQQRDYVTEGFCAVAGCWTQALAYIVSFPILAVIVHLFKVAYTMILLRSIKPEDKSVALGTFETFICMFGFIPYPIAFGALVDSACLIWEKSCGQTGNCWFYDISRFNYLLHGASALFSSFSVVTLFAIYCNSERVHNLYEEDYENEVHPDMELKNVEVLQDNPDSKEVIKF